LWCSFRPWWNFVWIKILVIRGKVHWMLHRSFPTAHWNLDIFWWISVLMILRAISIQYKLRFLEIHINKLALIISQINTKWSMACTISRYCYCTDLLNFVTATKFRKWISKLISVVTSHLQVESRVESSHSKVESRVESSQWLHSSQVESLV
jgi:hypothetical protein